MILATETLCPSRAGNSFCVALAMRAVVHPVRLAFASKYLKLVNVKYCLVILLALRLGGTRKSVRMSGSPAFVKIGFFAIAKINAHAIRLDSFSISSVVCVCVL
ncbi:hypothetical protein NL676_010396 [Syzygium grande]|nr:hypothetical protein NL676_010396 [Syzygium grande]